VLEPELDDTALTRARRAVASELSDLRDNAYGVAVNHMMQRLYGPSHVLGQHAKLAMQRADKHDLAAVRGGYRARFVPAASVLIVAGDVRAEEVEAQTRALFGAWKNVAEAPLTYEPPTWVPRGKRNVCLHMADSRQAVIVVGQKAPAPNAVDYEALRALVHILGGSASSRLTRALRDEQGATYHVGARLAPRRDGSTLLIETSTVNDAAPEALARIRKELGRLRTEPVTRDELRRAQHALLDELGSSVASASGAVHTLASMLSMGQWHGDLQKQVQAILALDEARLLAAAKAHLTPEAPAILVGDMDGYGKLGQWAYADNEMLPE
jgi:predicted Zn-dependent peptidase